MKHHYNLYYLFQEDKKQHPLPEDKDKEIKKKLKKIYRKMNLKGAYRTSDSMKI